VISTSVTVPLEAKARSRVCSAAIAPVPETEAVILPVVTVTVAGPVLVEALEDWMK
jgi:hypothetical protein